MSFRKDFIDRTSSFSGSLPLDMLCALTGQNFIIPFYHVVSDEKCPHIENLYCFKNVKQFESDLDYLTTHYQPISAGDLNDVLAGKYTGKKIMLLTFDDGLRQMYDVVAPILVRRGIPAVFFINTDFIDNKALMFRYKVSLASAADYDAYYDLFYNLMDIRNDKTLNDIINDECRDKKDELHKLFSDFLREYKPYMTSEQVRSLMVQGFTVGAHSCSHLYYEDLTLDEQLSETLDCLDILKSAFGIREKLFAFPFTDHGVSKRFFDKIFDSSKVDFSFGGAGIKRDVHARQFQRIPMEGWDAGAEQILKSEYLYYILRMPLGRNTIIRR